MPFIVNNSISNVQLENNITIPRGYYRFFTDAEMQLPTLSYALNAGWIAVSETEPTGMKPPAEFNPKSSNPVVDSGASTFEEAMAKLKGAEVKAAEPIKAEPIVVDAAEKSARKGRKSTASAAVMETGPVTVGNAEESAEGTAE